MTYKRGGVGGGPVTARRAAPSTLKRPHKPEYKDIA